MWDFLITFSTSNYLSTKIDNLHYNLNKTCIHEEDEIFSSVAYERQFILQ